MRMWQAQQTKGASLQSCQQSEVVACWYQNTFLAKCQNLKICSLPISSSGIPYYHLLRRQEKVTVINPYNIIQLWCEARVVCVEVGRPMCYSFMLCWVLQWWSPSLATNVGPCGKMWSVSPIFPYQIVQLTAWAKLPRWCKTSQLWILLLLHSGPLNG